MRRALPFVADTDGEAVCDQRAVQRIFDAGDADVFHTVRQRQYGKRIALAGGKGNCAVGDQMQPRLAPIKRRLRAMSAGKRQTLDISQQMVQPATQRAVEPDLRKALGYSPAHRCHRIGVVLFYRQVQHRHICRQRAAVGIKIADEQIRTDAGISRVDVAPVAGDDEIGGFDAAERVLLPAGNDGAKLFHSASQRRRTARRRSQGAFIVP